jgi:predicted alpha/beta hydrolase family esterase
MVHVLFVQGGGAGAYDAWDSKLVASLSTELGPYYRICYPRMPDEAGPDYAVWARAITKELAACGDGVILVGHSIGATMLVSFLAEGEPKEQLSGIFLVAAPFIGEGGWPSDDLEPMNDIGTRLPNGVPVYLYHGSEDETTPIAHVELYARAIPQAVVRRLEGRDHQLNENMSEVARDIEQLDSEI